MDRDENTIKERSEAIKKEAKALDRNDFGGTRTRKVRMRCNEKFLETSVAFAVLKVWRDGESRLLSKGCKEIVPCDDLFVDPSAGPELLSVSIVD